MNMLIMSITNDSDVLLADCGSSPTVGSYLDETILATST